MADVKSKLSKDEKVAAARALYQAVERGDLRKGAEGLADDAVFHSRLRQRDFKGRDEILAEQLKQRDEFKAEYKLHDVTASDDHVVALLEVTQEVNGTRSSHKLVHVLHVDDDGKVKECWSIFNPES
jgi:ketosteroid isomerase-like protein